MDIWNRPRQPQIAVQSFEPLLRGRQLHAALARSCVKNNGSEEVGMSRPEVR